MGGRRKKAAALFWGELFPEDIIWLENETRLAWIRIRQRELENSVAKTASTSVPKSLERLPDSAEKRNLPVPSCPARGDRRQLSLFGRPSNLLSGALDTSSSTTRYKRTFSNPKFKRVHCGYCCGPLVEGMDEYVKSGKQYYHVLCLRYTLNRYYAGRTLPR
jgi:hypothetical protein